MAGRNSTPIQNYIKLADENDLICLFSVSPKSIKVSVLWQCTICNRIMTKSYHTLKHSHNPCRCRSKLNKKMWDYHSLANHLGIDWIDPVLPYNIHTETQWKNKEGKIFNASYHQLGYNRIPHRLQEYLNNDQ